MKKTLRSFCRQAAALSVKQRSGLSLLVPCSAILSLAYGGYFLAGLHADTTETHPLIVASQAVSRQVYGQSAAAPRAAVSDVVTKALAFKATLSSTQQATLEQAYTPALARKWSNLPCANTCRNCIGLGTLTAD